MAEKTLHLLGQIFFAKILFKLSKLRFVMKLKPLTELKLSYSTEFVTNYILIDWGKISIVKIDSWTAKIYIYYHYIFICVLER